MNRLLAKYKQTHGLDKQYKMGPDPSSIDSCMIGGVVANNSSGMCCGVKQNTYHTLKDMRIVFVDGTVLDTSDEASRAAFLKSHAKLVEGIVDLAKRVQADEQLSQLIRKNRHQVHHRLLDECRLDHPVDGPIEIIKRLMIGGEEHPRIRLSGDVQHRDRPSAQGERLHRVQGCSRGCRRRWLIASERDGRRRGGSSSTRVLAQCEGHEQIIGLVPTIADAPKTGAALLIECRGATDDELNSNIKAVTTALDDAKMDYLNDRESTYPFVKDEAVYKVYWDVRKGLIPLVGSSRSAGTSVLIEDVACEVDKLGDMTQDLIDMFERFGYDDASVMGHALEGNLHLVFSQGFRNDDEVKMYAAMMQELCEIVAEKYQGSLKAEHGTGRNVAPFVEMEWGTKAYDLMWELKQLFDPEFVLNPGVILNRDPDTHQKFLKPKPVADPIVDMCMECGFCESNCPSRDLSLTPRQRITEYREISSLQAIPSRSNEEQQRLDEFLDIFTYEGNSTCAADGMCQVKCPVGINTGELIKSIRERELKTASTATKGADALARNFSTFAGVVPGFLNFVSMTHGLLGGGVLRTVSKALNSASGNLVPVWNEHMPTGAPALPPAHVPASRPAEMRGLPRKVVYLPSCVTRMMGPVKGEEAIGGVPDAMMSILKKADYEVVYPQGLSNSCCGMLFNSRGFKATASVKGGELEAALMEASEGGMLPIVVDTSPCLAQIKEQLSNPALRFSLYEPTEFISNHLVDKLEWNQVRDHIAIHVPCSSKKLGVEATFSKIAGLCAKEVTPSGIPCCGMAGDRGMRFPELTGSSLNYLELPQSCSDGYSTSRTCEMSLSNHSDVNFRGLVYLVDEATSAKK